MPKLHTRQERRFRMQTLRGRKRSKRPKTFKTEGSLKKYAEANNITKYKIVDLKAASPTTNKFKIVPE